MKIAVLSGKGGTGKTFVSVNLAVVSQSATYIDCDVEEPNGHLFLKPEHVTMTTVNTMLPDFDTDKCTGCRKCVDFCRFNALAFIKRKPKVFPEICHSCGGCVLVCPVGAVTEHGHPVGRIEHGALGDVSVVTGVLNLGEASAVPVIRAALAEGLTGERHTVIDCPPGSGCPVLESVSASDYCVLVAEPTAFGLHNLQMVVEMVKLLKKPCGIVINKMEYPYEPLEDFCRQSGIPVLCRIPYSETLARLNAAAQIAYEHDESTRMLFDTLFKRIEAEVKP